MKVMFLSLILLLPAAPANAAGETEGADPTSGRLDIFNDPAVLDGRTLSVYLPPGYDDDGSARHPVLIMLDGQNLYDAETSYAGEWRVDETCDRLIATGRIRPVVVVGIDNGGQARLHEYTPWVDADHGGGDGVEHLRRIVEEVLPAVRARYRTLDGPENTALAGSSLGGLMAAYAAFAHADVFGAVGAISPSIQWADGELVKLAERSERPPVRIWLDMGTREWRLLKDADGNGTDDMIDWLRRLRNVLLEKGYFPGDDLLVMEDEGAVHHESAWAERLPRILRFLFPPK